MIFVALGTQDKSFDRLLRIIDKKINDGIIKEKVIVQAGYTKYISDNMEIFDYISNDLFLKYISDCRILITHGGAGSILTGLKYNKKVMAMPRLACYHEQHNDHQLQLVQEFTNMGYILSFNDSNSFDIAYKKIARFKPKKFISNTDNMIKLIEDFINSN